MAEIPMDVASFRRDLVAWLDAADLAPSTAGRGTLDDQMAQYFRVKRALWDAGFGRCGWPEHVDGLGGPALLRAVVGEEVAARGLADPGCWSMIEVLAPTVLAFGPESLVQAMVPPLLRGDELWCQGFSEPDAGSDLASLTCKATAVDGGWRVNGQKVWTSYAQFAQRCVLLTRTGDPGSAHRGITALFVDVDSPGLTYRPIETQHGRPEFCEVFFDDVFVPADRLLGDVGQGWQIAMDVLPYERSTTFWHRGAHLLQRCSDLVGAVAEADDVPATAAKSLGEAYQAVLAFRLRSRATQHRLAAGHPLGAETSIDKILIAGAEQRLLDTARDLLPGVIELDDDPQAEAWREDWLYAKAATIYGGTAEIQRNIVARRLLDLGAEA
ncbi:MAG TPA: acyl-CoA dehydrogenase family protein [Acidimicrobiales bacterium]|nr:acyl-CoA dehydrogenase family protein [Acidimicrobiales bacterium]